MPAFPRLRLASPPNFARRALPYLHARAALISAESLCVPVYNSRSQERLALLNNFYLVHIGTRNDIETLSQSLGCIGGPAEALRARVAAKEVGPK